MDLDDVLLLLHMRRQIEKHIDLDPFVHVMSPDQVLEDLSGRDNACLRRVTDDPSKRFEHAGYAVMEPCDAPKKSSLLLVKTHDTQSNILDGTETAGFDWLGRPMRRIWMGFEPGRLFDLRTGGPVKRSDETETLLHSDDEETDTWPSSSETQPELHDENPIDNEWTHLQAGTIGLANIVNTSNATDTPLPTLGHTSSKEIYGEMLVTVSCVLLWVFLCSHICKSTVAIYTMVRDHRRKSKVEINQDKQSLSDSIESTKAATDALSTMMILQKDLKESSNRIRVLEQQLAREQRARKQECSQHEDASGVMRHVNEELWRKLQEEREKYRVLDQELSQCRMDLAKQRYDSRQEVAGLRRTHQQEMADMAWRLNGQATSDQDDLVIVDGSEVPEGSSE